MWNLASPVEFANVVRCRMLDPRSSIRRKCDLYLIVWMFIPVRSIVVGGDEWSLWSNVEPRDLEWEAKSVGGQGYFMKQGPEA